MKHSQAITYRQMPIKRQQNLPSSMWESLGLRPKSNWRCAQPAHSCTANDIVIIIIRISSASLAGAAS